MVYISGGNELLDATKIYEHLGLHAGMRVADLGCGASGLFTVTAARFVGAKGMVFAVDILRSVLEEVAKKARLEGVNNIKTIWADLELYNSVNIKSKELDMAFLINVLFQSKEHANIIKEASRLVKTKGKILVVDWKQSGTPFGPPSIDRIKPTFIKKIAAGNRLKLIDEFEAGNYHFGFIFEKEK